MKLRTCMLTAALVMLIPDVSFATSPGSQSNSALSNHNFDKFRYGWLSADWWQWMYALPAATNLNLSQGVVDCSLGQLNHGLSAKTWFLAGNFGGVSDRTCTVPSYVALFFPLLNIELDNVGCCTPTSPPFSYSIQEMKQLAAAAQDNPLELHASLDGVPLPALRVQSHIFSYSVPAKGNVLQFLGLTVPGANWPIRWIFPAVSDGYWVELKPLSPGKHVLKFGGIANNGFTVDVTYHLTVVP